MPQNPRGNPNPKQPKAKPENTPPQTVVTPKPALIEGTEPTVIYCQPHTDQNAPQNPFVRWLYYRSQIILGVLTFGVVVFNAVMWWEYRSTRELENRAYVAAKEVRLIQDTLNPDVNNIFVTCVNAGRTTGQNGNIVTQIETRETSPPEDTVINQPEKPSSKTIFSPQVEISKSVGAMPAVRIEGTKPESGAPTIGAIPPNIVQTVPPSKNTTQLIPQAKDKKLWYVYGVITYEDIFGKTHRTKFCFQNIPFTSVWCYCPT